MKCDAVDQHLSELVDDALDSAKRAEVETHLAECPDCRRKLEGLRRIIELVKGSTQAQAPEGLAQAVAARIDEETSQSRPRWWKMTILWPVVGAAAVVLIAIGVQMFYAPPRPTEEYELVPKMRRGRATDKKRRAAGESVDRSWVKSTLSSKATGAMPSPAPAEADAVRAARPPKQIAAGAGGVEAEVRAVAKAAAAKPQVATPAVVAAEIVAPSELRRQPRLAKGEHMVAAVLAEALEEGEEEAASIRVVKVQVPDVARAKAEAEKMLRARHISFRWEGDDASPRAVLLLASARVEPLVTQLRARLTVPRPKAPRPVARRRSVKLALESAARTDGLERMGDRDEKEAAKEFRAPEGERVRVVLQLVPVHSDPQSRTGVTEEPR